MLSNTFLSPRLHTVRLTYILWRCQTTTILRFVLMLTFGFRLQAHRVNRDSSPSSLLLHGVLLQPLFVGTFSSLKPVFSKRGFLVSKPSGLSGLGNRWTVFCFLSQNSLLDQLSPRSWNVECLQVRVSSG